MPRLGPRVIVTFYTTRRVKLATGHRADPRRPRQQARPSRPRYEIGDRWRTIDGNRHPREAKGQQRGEQRSRASVIDRNPIGPPFAREITWHVVKSLVNNRRLPRAVSKFSERACPLVASHGEGRVVNRSSRFKGGRGGFFFLPLLCDVEK